MKRYVWIVLIILLAGILRFWNLTQVPPALNSDEVAIGYNAYSVLKTGKDEYGTRFPLTFRSFDDYKLPVYVYMVAGSMRIFGYNDFAVRFPSALFGTLTVLLTFVFVKELFVSWGPKRSNLLALFASFHLAVSPWSVQFSRAGYEANVAVFFIVCGAYAFLLGLTKGWWLVLSSFMFSLAIWTYLTPRIFVPLLVLGCAVIYGKKIWKMKTAALTGIILAIILLFPIIKMSFSREGQMRAAGVSAFANTDDIRRSVSRIALDESKGLRLLTIFDNRRLIYAITFLRGYFSHFDPNFLFLDKSIDKYRAPDMGLMYLFELPLFLAGAYHLIRKWSHGSALVFWWILAAPVAAAFTLQLPHPVRTLVFLPSLQIVSAVGALVTAEAIHRIYLKNRIAGSIYILFAVLTVAVSVAYYLLQYFVHLPVEDASYWYAGRKEMVQKLESYENQYDTIYVSNSLDFPYIFFLYYRHVDPRDYLNRGGTVSGGFTEQRNAYGKYSFRSISPSLRTPNKKVLFVGLPGEVFRQQLVIDRISYPDGTPAIMFFK